VAIKPPKVVILSILLRLETLGHLRNAQKLEGDLLKLAATEILTPKKNATQAAVLLEKHAATAKRAAL